MIYPLRAHAVAHTSAQIRLLLISLFIAAGLASAQTPAATTTGPLVRAAAPGEARWMNGFWQQKTEIVHTQVLHRLLADFQNGATPHLRNFRLAAGLGTGSWTGSFATDGELYEWIEAAALTYADTKDAALDREMDALIAVIAKAQQPDGYLATAVQTATGTATADCNSTGTGAFQDAKRFATPRYAELDNLGRLFSAAVTHHAATGKNSLLDVATRAADLVNAELGKPASHLPQLARVPSIIGGAMELFRLTGERRHLGLAQAFIDRRGLAGQADFGALQRAYTADFTDENSGVAGTDQFQERTPLRDEREAVGNTVSAHQLYAGAAAVSAAIGDRHLGLALEKIWEDAAEKKMTVTGATGALFAGVSSVGYKSWGDRVTQAYGAGYELPTGHGFYGTCGNAGFADWNWRMFEHTGEARYLDALERVAYNALLAALSLDGSAVATANPLRRDATTGTTIGNRRPLSAVPCCAISVARAVATLAARAYGVSADGLWVNLYGAGTLDTHLPDGTPVGLKQQTDYPWNGDVTLTLDLPRATPFSLRLRVPGWCRAAEVPVWVNSQPVPAASGTTGWIKLDRTWAAGDTVRLALPMPAELLAGHPQIEEVRGRVAIQRGPVVYCLESGDLANGPRVDQVRLARGTKLQPAFVLGLLDGIGMLEGRVTAEESPAWQGELYRERARPERREATVRFIPYFVWNNRDAGDMAVWLPLID